MSLVEDADQVAAALTDAGGKCYTDPGKAAANRPCLLVAPPSVDYVRRTVAWRLVALAGTDEPSLRAFRDLDELVAFAHENNLVPIEAAEAASYPLIPDRAPIPAYLIRFTTSTEEH